MEENGKQRVIGEEELMKTLNYLVKQPWIEVNEIINSLQSLPEFVSTKPEEE